MRKLSVSLSVRPSIRPSASVKRVDGDKTKESSTEKVLLRFQCERDTFMFAMLSPVRLSVCRASYSGD